CGPHQAFDAEHAFGLEGFRIEEIVVDAAVYDVDRLWPRHGFHKDLVVFHEQVPSFDERNADLTSEENVFEIGRVEHAWREQHDLRIGDARRRNLQELVTELCAVFGNALDFEAMHKIGKSPLHQMPTLDDIRYAGRRPPVVFQHKEIAAGIADAVGSANVDIGAARRIVADHFRPVVRISQHEI